MEGKRGEQMRAGRTGEGRGREEKEGQGKI